MFLVQALVLVATGVLVFEACHGQTLPSYNSAEEARSRLTAARIESEWPLLGPGRVVNYVHAVGLRLEQAASNRYGPPNYPWRFKVVRDRAVTAFAVGGGRIYVSDGALDASRDDAEFAALLAHEMGHQIERHFAEPPAPPQSADGRSHRPVGTLSFAVDPANELQADEVSLELLEAAGYDPHAALRVANRALERSEPRATDPWSEQRIAALTRLLENVPPSPSKPSSGFLAAKRALALP